MRLGLFGARADARGLGIQTLEFARHLRPEKVVVVDMGKHTPLRQELQRFPGGEVLRFGAIAEDEMRRFLAGLDAVYCAETPYDDRLFTFAREMGVRSVLHANFEFLRHLTDPAIPRPDLFLAPSPWQFNRFPQPRALLPFPVARDRLPFRRRESVATFLHVAGPGTVQDRNGTRVLFEALRYLRQPCKVIVRSQVPLPPRRATWRPHVEVVVQAADVADYWRIYEGADALVLTRRFGGLCLPLNEAASLGMPMIVTDREPERSVLPPECQVRAPRKRSAPAQSGRMEVLQPDARSLALRMDALVSSPELVARLSDASDAYASSISWDALADRFRAVLAGDPVPV